jgi:hypothetical protein
MKYQVIAEVPDTTEMEALPAVFQGIAEAMDILPISQRQMPGTRAFNGRMLVHMEVKQVTAVADVMSFLASGIGAAFGQTWTVVAAQTTLKHKQYDVDGNPVMVDSGEVDEESNPIMVHEEKVNVDIPLSESYFLDFMPDVPVYDTDGETVIGTERPTVAAPHKMAGAEPWELIA